jgi:hypothetical protein
MCSRCRMKIVNQQRYRSSDNNKNVMLSNVMHTTHFRNNLHQGRSKSKDLWPNNSKLFVLICISFNHFIFRSTIYVNKMLLLITAYTCNSFRIYKKKVKNTKAIRSRKSKDRKYKKKDKQRYTKH